MDMSPSGMTSPKSTMHDVPPCTEETSNDAPKPLSVTLTHPSPEMVAATPAASAAQVEDDASHEEATQRACVDDKGGGGEGGVGGEGG